MSKIRNSVFRLVSFLSGAINALFGSGGGILFVIALNKKGLSQKKSQATALAVTVLLSAFSTAYYLFNGYFKIEDAISFIPWGIPGALTGSLLLKKLPDGLLRKIFSAFIIWAGVRMIFR
ncbi:MAG: sulfite exporter TauE/SafE family protein [Ruminococcaceae bacterium]|nr:sulfite exporter TauE/SafE family protein [Oscillospiraceae bacterium]